MSLKLSVLPTSAPHGITCTDWSHCGDPSQKRRCAHIVRENPTEPYSDNTVKSAFSVLPDKSIWRGACVLPSRLMCEEWLKIHPEDQMPPRVVSTGADKVADKSANGPAVTQEGPKDAPTPSQAAPLAWRPSRSATEAPRAIPEDAARLLAEQGIEAEVREGATSVHLVPEYTEEDRLEISFEGYALIQSALELFPGAELVSLVKRPKTSPASEPRRKVFELHVTDALRKRMERLDPRTGTERK